MKNLLPEFSAKLFNNPNQLDLYQEMVDIHPINGLGQDISKEEFDKKYLTKIDTPQLAFEYCYKYKVKNNPEMERIIIKNAGSAYQYATGVLGGKFELGEEIIASRADYAYYYAEFQLKGRFQLGEPVILKDNYFRALYQHFLSPEPSKFQKKFNITLKA